MERIHNIRIIFPIIAITFIFIVIYRINDQKLEIFFIKPNQLKEKRVIDMSEESKYKFIVCGEKVVAKLPLFIAILTGNLSKARWALLGWILFTKKLLINEKNINLTIWDFGGKKNSALCFQVIVWVLKVRYSYSILPGMLVLKPLKIGFK